MNAFVTALLAGISSPLLVELVRLLVPALRDRRSGKAGLSYWRRRAFRYEEAYWRTRIIAVRLGADEDKLPEVTDE